MRLIRRLALFLALPVVSAVSPILVLPTLTATLGGAAWSAIAVGQSVGAFGAMVLSFSWNVTGPSTAAASDPAARARLYADSVASRMVSGLVAVPIAWFVALALSPSDAIASALMAVAVTVSGALPTWYYVGTGEPLRIFTFDAGPRLLAAGAAIIALPVIREVWLFPVCLLVVTLASAALSASLITGRHLRGPSRRDLIHFRNNALLVSSGLISSGYTTSAVSLVALTAPTTVAAFAAAQRVQGFVLSGIAAITSAQQGWVSAFDASEQDRRRRRRRAFAINGAIGLVAGVVVVVGLDAVVAELFSGTVTLSDATPVLVGLSVLVLSLNLSATFHIHIPAGRRSQLAFTGLLSTGVGVPALLILARTNGLDGALLAVLIAETVSLAAQIVLVLASRRPVGRPRATTPPAWALPDGPEARSTADGSTAEMIRTVTAR